MTAVSVVYAPGSCRYTVWAAPESIKTLEGSTQTPGTSAFAPTGVYCEVPESYDKKYAPSGTSVARMVITSVVPDGPMSIVKSSFPVAASPDPAATFSVGIVAG